MKKGFSLAELIVSIFLLGLVIGAVVNLFPYSLLMVSRSEGRLQAVQLAQAAIEQKAREPWAQLVASSSSTESVALGGRSFRRTLEVTRPSPMLCHLVVQVNWDDQGRTWTITEELDVAELHR